MSRSNGETDFSQAILSLIITPSHFINIWKKLLIIDRYVIIQEYGSTTLIGKYIDLLVLLYYMKPSQQEFIISLWQKFHKSDPSL